MKLDLDILKRMLHSALVVRPDEIGCDDCLEQLDRFVDLRLAGRDVAQAMPLVTHHLSICTDCNEEFQALMTVLQVLEQRDATRWDFSA